MILQTVLHTMKLSMVCKACLGLGGDPNFSTLL